MKGWVERREELWIARASRVFPVPVSPRIRIGSSVRALLDDASPRPVHHLPYVRFALAQKLGDIRVRVLERGVEQEGGPLVGGEPLQQEQERDREVVGEGGRAHQRLR